VGWLGEIHHLNFKFKAPVTMLYINSTHGIKQIDPFTGWWLHKLAIQKQFSCRLKPETMADQVYKKQQTVKPSSIKLSPQTCP